MTDEIKFSGKLAKTIKIGDFKVDEQNADKKLLEAIFGENAIKDNDITLDELTTAISKLDENKDGKIDNIEIGHAIDKYKQSHSSAQIDTTAYAKHLKAIAEKNNALVQDQANVGNGYTIQLGEDLTDLVTRVLKSQGVKEDDSDWNTKFENCKNTIIANNPNSMKIEDGKVKWLIAGTKIYLPTDTSTSKAKKTVLDQNNQDKVIEKYQKWQNGEIQSFRYKVDDQGNTYEVRSGQDDKKYGTVKGSAAERRIVSANLAKAVDVNKLRGGKITVGEEEKEYSDDEVREKAQIALDILSQLEDSDNIDKVSKDEKNKRYYIHLKSGGQICVIYDNTGKITSVAAGNKGDRYLFAKFNANGEFVIDADISGSFDFKAKHGVKDFGAIEKLIKAHDSVREVMGLPKRDFIDYDMITEGDLDGNDEETVKNQIKSATEIIAGLEITSDIKEVKLETKEDGKKEKIIKLNDGTIVKASMDKNNNITKVSVKRSGNDKIDVTFDLTNDNNKITVDLGSNKDKIEAYDAIKDIGAITKFITNISAEIKEEVVRNNQPTADNAQYLEAKTQGEGFGQAIFEEAHGWDWDSNDDVYIWIDQLNSKNVYFAINEFNKKSYNATSIGQQGIIQYLDNESGFSAKEIAKIFKNLLDMAEEAKIDTKTPEYRAVLGQYNTFQNNASNRVDNEEITIQADKDVLNLMALINKSLQLNEPPISAVTGKNVVAAENASDLTYHKAGAVKIANDLFEEVEGSAIFGGNDPAYDLIDSINEDNVYYVIDNFNFLSGTRTGDHEGIVQYLDNESGFRADKIAHIIDSLLKLADKAEISKTNSAYSALEKARDTYNVKGAEELDNDTFSKATDINIRTLMTAINNKMKLATYKENLVDPVDATIDNNSKYPNYYIEQGVKKRNIWVSDDFLETGGDF